MQPPKGHYWSEFVRADDAFWRGIRSSLVGFFAIGPKFSPLHLGTGFVIGAVPDHGLLLVLTAKHVVTSAAKIQSPVNKRAASAPSILFEVALPLIGPDEMRGIWMGADCADVLFVGHISYHDNLDVALCILEAQEELRPNVHTMVAKVNLETQLPATGSSVHIVSLTDFKLQGKFDSNECRTWNFGSRPVIRVGKVLSQETSGMGHSGICFRTSIPTEPGMSGGYAYIPRSDGQPIAACGIVSTNLDSGQPTTRFDVCGNSLRS